MKAGIQARGAVALAAVALTGVSGVLAEARVFVGTKKANKVTGTKKGDTIRLGAGELTAPSAGAAAIESSARPARTVSRATGVATG